MERENRLGIIFGTVGALLNSIGGFAIFMTWYQHARNLVSPEPGCELILKYIMPGLSDMGILAAVLFAGSAYGFFMKRDWAFPLMVIANILALQATWFVSVPFMAAGESPIYFILFWPNLLLFFLNVKLVGARSWGLTLLGFFAALGFIFCFMNGVASWSRILTTGKTLFFFTQRLSWFSSIGWGVVAAALLIRPGEWVRILGLAAACLQVLVGTPLAIQTTIDLERFSMFSIAPIESLLLFLFLLSPARFQRIAALRE